MQVELGFENGVIGDIFSVPGYEIRGHVVAQVYIFFWDCELIQEIEVSLALFVNDLDFGPCNYSHVCDVLVVALIIFA